MKLRTVLVPLDGSPLGEAALPMAEDLLRDHPEATLLLMRATEAPALPGFDPTAAQVAAVQEAEAYLEGVAAHLRERGLGRVRVSVWYGPPAASIVEAAEARDVDLIVMSTHGRSGLGRLILGSVAESVLRSTRRPILLVRARGAPVERPSSSSTPAGAEGAARV